MLLTGKFCASQDNTTAVLGTHVELQVDYKNELQEIPRTQNWFKQLHNLKQINYADDHLETNLAFRCN